ncbi:MAG: ArsR family transcriptional regulator [Candidatus Aenigmarchaeota archaeon]|nr:ArsR family transcriptional regulator [Candidatus Aenigmarchaeota archaeon]
MNYAIKGKDNKTYNIKKIEVQNIKSLSENAIKILKILSEKEMYPKQIAQLLKMNEQKVYYYINLLKKTKLIDVTREEKYGGLIAKYYTCSSDGALVLWNKLAIEKNKIKDDFLLNFTKNNFSKTVFVLGSPFHHGRQMAKAEDEKQAILVALFMGGLAGNCSANISNIKYDTEIEEEDLKKNLIIVGGPAINKTAELMNKSLAVKFVKKDNFYHALYSSISKKEYSDENCGFIEKTKNPFNKYAEILIFGGRRRIGTAAAVFFLINKLNSFEKGNKYNKNIFSKIIKGIDENNDGFVDRVEELE